MKFAIKNKNGDKIGEVANAKSEEDAIKKYAKKNNYSVANLDAEPIKEESKKEK